MPEWINGQPRDRITVPSGPGGILVDFGTEVVNVDAIVGVDGRLIKYGVATLANASQQSVTYTTPFANQTDVVILTPHGNFNVWPTSITKTGFTINASATITGSVSWHARGS